MLYADTGGDNDGSNGTGNVYTYNCFGAESNDFISWGGTAHDTYDAWEAVYGGSSYRVEADPAFKDTAKGCQHRDLSMSVLSGSTADLAPLSRAAAVAYSAPATGNPPTSAGGTPPEEEGSHSA